MKNLKNLLKNQKNSKSSKKSNSSKVDITEDENLLNVVPIASHKDEELPVFQELSSRYRIVQKLGEGAFSKVYKAFDSHLHIEVAIKIIEKDSMSSSQIDTVLKEISIMRRLDHSNVVRLYDYINTEKRTFIVIEYVSGGELFNQIVKYTYFSEDLSRHIIIQVVKAVDYLHCEVGVVHRDIKPENLLFEKIDYVANTPGKYTRRQSDDEHKIDEGEFRENIGGGMVGTVKLADFGLSKVLWDSNTKTPCGTASYTAPEIVKDEAYSKSVDMWAIGCVLYTLLCGFPPFYDTDPKILTTKVAKGEYTFLSPWWDEISKEAKDLVSHLLTVDPKQRYGPDEVLNHPWILNNSKPTNPASDAPLYQTKNQSVLRFEETIPTIQNSSHLSPRAEAMKFAFDTGISIQRTATPLRRLLDEDDYFNESDEDDSDDLDSDVDDEDDVYDSEEDYDGNHYGYNDTTLTKSSIIKNLQNIKINDLPNTPHHCSFKSKHKNSMSSNSSRHKNSISSGSSVTSNVQPVFSSASSSKTVDATPIPSRHERQSFFKEIDGFNLNMNGNTLLTRRKITGSQACGPAV